MLRAGTGNPLLDLLRGLDDVRRALFALAFEREFIGILRGPLAVNVVAVVLAVAVGWLWLAPAYADWFAAGRAHSRADGPHLWLFASWLALGPTFLRFFAGAAQRSLSAATERHMLRTQRAAQRVRPPHRLRDAVLLLMLAVVLLPFLLAIVLVPWVGVLLAIALGSAHAALVWCSVPLLLRGLDLPRALPLLLRNRWRALGVGLGVQLAAVVPFVNLLALAPIATIAAVSAYLQFDKRDPEQVAP